LACTTYKVEQALADIKKQLPAGVEMDSEVFRQANFIETAIHNLNESLMQGALIVVGVLLLFLMNWRASLITFLSMPASFVGGIVVMHALGPALASGGRGPRGGVQARQCRAARRAGALR
jgi:Cu/Ag efflux pump CusA